MVSCQNTSPNWLRLALEVSLVAVTVVGNLLVILSVGLVKVLRKPKNYLLLSLAVADLLVGILVLPSKIILMESCNVWVSKTLNCCAITPLQVDILCCTASILSLAVIAMDRYIAISYPLFYKVTVTRRKALGAILFTWLASTVTTIPYWSMDIVHREVIHSNIFSTCMGRRGEWNRILSLVLSFFLPLCLMLYMYGKIWFVLRKQKIKSSLHLHHISQYENYKIIPSNPANSIFDKILQTLHNWKGCTVLGTIVGFFVICWVPFFSLLLIVALCDLSGTQIYPSPIVFETLAWLGYSNSSVNPFVYTIFSKDFRQAFKEILSFNCCTVNIKIQRRRSGSLCDKNLRHIVRV